MSAGRLTPAQRAWLLTEAANEPYFTIVRTWVFAAYFTAVLAPGPAGQSAWGYVQGAVGLLLALSAPLVGALVDAGGRRRPWLVAVGLAGALGSLSLWFVAPGTSLLWAGLAVVAATLAFELLIVVGNACLPVVATSERAGLLSGFNLGLGQLAGLAALLLIVALDRAPPAWLAGVPHGLERLSGPIGAVAVVAFLLPLVLTLPEPPREQRRWGAVVRASLATLAATAREAVAVPNMRRFLLGRMLAVDGLSTILAFGGVLAVTKFGWGSGTLAGFGAAVTVFSASGGVAGGLLDRRLGARGVLRLGLVLLLAGIVGLVVFDAVVPFVGSAMLLALGAGPSYAAMRTLMARLAPVERSGAYFGLFSLVGKATTFVGPLLVGLVTDATGSLRLALLVSALLVGAGLALLWGVREDRVPSAA